MSVSWRVEVWVDGLGHLTRTSADTTTQPAPGDLALVAPFSLGETTDDNPWPAQPREYARVTILANTAAELAGPVKGTQVCIGFKTPSTAAGSGDGWDWRLVGLVDSYTLRPLSGGPGELAGVVAEIGVVDCRIGKLSDLDAGTTDRAQESSTARIQSALGAFNTSAPSPWDSGSDPQRAARSASRTSALDLVDRVLESWPDFDTSDAPLGRPVLTPQTTGSAYDIDSVVQAVDGTDGRPIWYLVRQDKVAALSDRIDVPGDLVDLDGVSWSAPGQSVPTRVTVTWNNGGTEDANTDENADFELRPVGYSLQTDLVSNILAFRLLENYLPDAGAADWVVDQFTYRMGKGATDGPALPRVGRLARVTDIDPAMTPDGSDEYSGQVTSVDLTLTSNDLVVVFTCLPATGADVLDGGTAATTTWDDTLDGGDATTTFAPTYDGGSA